MGNPRSSRRACHCTRWPEAAHWLAADQVPEATAERTAPLFAQEGDVTTWRDSR